MSTPTITWTVPQLHRRPSTGQVTKVDWRCSAEQDGEYVDSYGQIQFENPLDPSDPAFVPFDQLTPAQVIQWVKDYMWEAHPKMHVIPTPEIVENGLRASLEIRLNPEIIPGTPW